MSSEEAYWWRERYRVLFERNVAGIILTNTEGRILDCNEPCARIFGFDSRDEMLTHSAWDFYFHRVERENLVSRLRTRGHCPAEKVCLRRKNGEPVWVLTSRTVASFADGLPELLQGTVIDITQQEEAQARPGGIKAFDSTAGVPGAAGARMADLSQRLATLLGCVSSTLQPNNLPKVDRTKVQECLRALEEIKMLVSELEVVRLFGESPRAS
jgi:PAS domain S-box-containing protein